MHMQCVGTKESKCLNNQVNSSYMFLHTELNELHVRRCFSFTNDIFLPVWITQEYQKISCIDSCFNEYKKTESKYHQPKEEIIVNL